MARPRTKERIATILLTLEGRLKDELQRMARERRISATLLVETWIIRALTEEDARRAKEQKQSEVITPSLASGPGTNWHQ